jgi:pimeloyl-ACP methyl ester carboxylesterase
VFERRQFGKDRHRVIFFIGGYKTEIGMYRPLYWLMRRLGYQIYAYVLDPKTVVASDITSYVKQIESVQQDIVSVIDELGEAEYYVMGNSLGSESALYALKHTPQIKSAFLVTARGSIAEFIWKSREGRSFKPAYEKNGYDFTQISQELSPAEPLSDLKLISDRPVYLVYSQRDNVIPPANTELLIEALSHMQVKRYRYGGHLVATLKGLAAFWRWHRFFVKQ